MTPTHIRLICGGCLESCKHTVSVPIFLFGDLDLLNSVLHRADFYLLEGSEDGAPLGLTALSVFCGDCAKKVLPPERAKHVDECRKEWLSSAS
jgi:hypothetical protein